MRLKQMTRWSLATGFQSYGIFYAFYALFIFLILTLFAVFSGVPIRGHFNTENTGFLFLFITGIITFAYHLRIGAANGISRRTVFINYILYSAALSVIVALGELVLSFITGTLMNADISNIPFSSSPWFSSFLFMICLGIAMTSLGIFIGGAYYRMNKITKILVSVLVPVSLFVGIPVLASVLPAEISAFIASYILLPFLDFLSGSVWNCMAASLIAAALFMLFNWLLIRRAPVKSQK